MENLSLETAQRYCVFQSSNAWYGIPCLNVRSVVPKPNITRLPFSDPVIRGVCHIRNEFLPVVSLRSLLNIQYEAGESEQQMIILSNRSTAWGLLVDRTDGLEDLETAYSTLSDSNDASWSKVIVGTATYRQHVIQVLDSDAIYQDACQLLESFWNGSTHLDQSSQKVTNG